MTNTTPYFEESLMVPAETSLTLLPRLGYDRLAGQPYRVSLLCVRISINTITQEILIPPALTRSFLGSQFARRGLRRACSV